MELTPMQGVEGWMECRACRGKWYIDSNLCPACGDAMNDEAKDLQVRFFEELKKCTADGQNKRARAEKPPWYIDPAHEAAIYSHLCKWKKGELVDPDSGAHPLVHLAWRALAIACQETGNVPAHPDACRCAQCVERGFA